MTDLANQKCVGHGEMQPLTPDEIKGFLGELKEGRSGSEKPSGSMSWEFLESQKITKLFKFDDFVKAMEFVNNIVPIAEAEGHHPDIAIHYNKVEITLWSHYINGLSINDFIMAAKIDQI